MANRASEETKSRTGIEGLRESSLKGWPPSVAVGWNLYSGQEPLLTASFMCSIDLDMSMPWAVQVLYAMTSDGPGQASASRSALTVWVSLAPRAIWAT